MGFSKLKHIMMTVYDDSLNSTVRGRKLAIFLIVYESLIMTILLGMTSDSQIYPFLQQQFSWITKFLLFWVHTNKAQANIFIIAIGGYWLVTLVLHVVCCASGRLVAVLRLNAEVLRYVLTIPFIAGLGFNAHKNFNISSLTSCACILMMALTLCYHMFVDLILFNFSMVSCDAFSRSPRERYYLHPILITLLVFVFLVNSMVGISGLFNVLVCVLLLVNLHSLYQAVFGMIDYDKIISKAKIFAVLFSLSIAFWDGIAYNMNVDLITDNFLVITLVFYGFLVMLLLNYRNYSVKSLRIEHIDNVHTATQFLIKFRANFQLFISSKSKKSLMLRTSVIQSHTRDCTDVDCSCRNRQKLYDPTSKQWGNASLAPHNDQVFCKFFLKTMFLQGLSKFREHKLIHLTFLYFNWDTFKLYTKIPELIQHFLSSFSGMYNLSDEQLVFHLRRVVLEHMNDRRRGEPTIPVEDIQKFDRGFNSLRQKIAYLVELYQALWKITVEPVVDQGALLRVCDQITDRKVLVQSLYEQCVVYNKRSKSLMVEMYLYCFKIAFDNWLGKRIKTEIETVGQNQSKQSVYHISNIFCGDDQTCTMKVSVSEDDLGLVQWVSSHFTKLFGYRRDEVAGKKVNMLMPPSYAQRHDTWMRNWKEKGTEFNMNKIRRFWIVDKNGHCCSSHSFIKIVPMLTHFELVGLIRKNNELDYILLNGSSGVIESTGKRLADNILSVDPQTLLHANIQFQVFSPELITLFNKNKPVISVNSTKSQTMSVYFLVPKRVPDFLRKYAVQKQMLNSLINSNSASKSHNEHNEHKLNNIITQNISDLITEADSESKIFFLTISVQKLHFSGENSSDEGFFYSAKIIQTELTSKVIPPLIKSLQDTVREQTYARLEGIKGERKNRGEQAVDIFRKMLDEKRSDMHSRGSYVRSVCLRRKKSSHAKEMVAKGLSMATANERTSIFKMTTSSKREQTPQQIAQQFQQQTTGVVPNPTTSTKEFNTRRKSCQSTLKKIRQVLRREEVLGRSNFSEFWLQKGPNLQGPTRLQTIVPQKFGDSGELALSKTIQMNSHNPRQQDNYDSVKTDDDREIQVMSAASAKTSASAEINFEELRKRQNSGKPHSSLSKYKSAMILIAVFYSLIKVLSILFINAIEPELTRMMTSQVQSSQVIIVLELFYHSALLINTTSVLAPSHVGPISKTVDSASAYINTLLGDHIMHKMDRDLINDEYYEYLDAVSQVKFAGKIEEVSGLQLIRLFQQNMADVVRDEMEGALSLLKLNYPTVQSLLRRTIKIYNSNVGSLLNMFKICLILRIVLNIALNITLLVLTILMFKKVESWLCQCMEMMASTPVETSLGCVKYYRKIKEDMKEPGGRYISTDLESYVQGGGTYRTPHTKGTVSPWFRNALVAAVVMFSLNELTSYNSFQLCDYYTEFSGFRELMAESQAGLIEASIRLKQDYLANSVNSTLFNATYYSSLTLYHSLITSSFERLSPLSDNIKLTSILKSDICVAFKSDPIEIDYQNCPNITINSYGLPMIVESIAASLFRMYALLEKDKALFEKQLVRPLQINNEYAIFYVFNGWIGIWRTIKNSLEFNLRSGLNWSNCAECIGYGVFMAVMYAILLAYLHSARSINRISSYVMVIPRPLALDNQYLKHFLRRFL